MSNKNIVYKFINRIKNKYSSDIVSKITNLTYQEKIYSRCNNKTDKEQIKIFNSFLRYLLIQKENTTELREWLTDDNNVDNYLLVLESSVLDKIIKVLVDEPKTSN